jgi:hypothetical protein
MEQAPGPTESDMAAGQDLKRRCKEALEGAEKDLEAYCAGGGTRK